MPALALAILGSPRCLLLDEPSIGLAPNLVERLLQQVRDVRKSHAMTAMLVEQSVAAAMKIAGRVAMMNNGLRCRFLELLLTTRESAGGC